jgi:hypothetical protein
MKPRRDVEPRRTVSVLDLDPVRMAAEISQLPPNHAHVAAARAAAEVSELRHDHKVALRDAAKDIAGDKVWQGYSSRHIPHEVIAARRAQPGPMARVPEQRTPAARQECVQRDSTAAAVARARAACRGAVKAREEEDRGRALNRDDRAEAAVDVRGRV